MWTRQLGLCLLCLLAGTLLPAQVPTWYSKNKSSIDQTLREEVSDFNFRIKSIGSSKYEMDEKLQFKQELVRNAKNKNLLLSNDFEDPLLREVLKFPNYLDLLISNFKNGYRYSLSEMRVVPVNARVSPGDKLVKVIARRSFRGPYVNGAVSREVNINDEIQFIFKIELYNNRVIKSSQCKLQLVSALDSDDDHTPDTEDACPDDFYKTEPGICGCGQGDVDSDGDGLLDCKDACPQNPHKQKPGICGCESDDGDRDGDGFIDCKDGCPEDRRKQAPGLCGCGVADTDSDGDGTADCKDGCPEDRRKIKPGICGCGQEDKDSDKDGVWDCNDRCPNLKGDKERHGCPVGFSNLGASLLRNVSIGLSTGTPFYHFADESAFDLSARQMLFSLDDKQAIQSKEKRLLPLALQANSAVYFTKRWGISLGLSYRFQQMYILDKNTTAIKLRLNQDGVAIGDAIEKINLQSIAPQIGLSFQPIEQISIDGSVAYQIITTQKFRSLLSGAEGVFQTSPFTSIELTLVVGQFSFIRYFQNIAAIPIHNNHFNLRLFELGFRLPLERLWN